MNDQTSRPEQDQTYIIINNFSFLIIEGKKIAKWILYFWINFIEINIQIYI